MTESKLREMIRGVIREFTTTATAAGAKKSGHKSADTRSKESDYNTKKTDYDTKKTDYDTKKAAVDDTRKYKSTPGRGVKGSAQYSSTNTGMRTAGFGPWLLNPEWTTQTSERNAAETTKDDAEAAKNRKAGHEVSEKEVLQEGQDAARVSKAYRGATPAREALRT